MGKLKKILLALGALILTLLAAGGAYVGCLVTAYEDSMAKVYDVPVPDVTASTDPEVIARGKHLAESLGACNADDCHGADWAGGRAIIMGPVGTLSGSNITPGGVLKHYSDGQLHRLLRHGIRHDGRSVVFMPVPEINWLPEQDVLAIISYLRTVPAIDGTMPPTEIGLLGKILDRRDQFHADIARRIDHGAPPPEVPEPAPNKAYGFFVARNCTGCHGGRLSGGPIPGAPSSLPIPTNITPHQSGIAGYSYGDFETLLETGVKPDGRQLDPFMPYTALAKMNDIEKQALWAYLQSVPPLEFGNR